MKNKIKRKFTLRTALMTAVTLALVASAAVFIGANAAENVTPSDVSPTRPPSGHHAGGKSVTVTRTDVSYSDVSAKLTYNAPEDLGDPVITMTTAKTEGETLNLAINGDNVFIDYGDGNKIAYSDGDAIKGSVINVFGNNITYFGCLDSDITSLDVSNCVNLKELHCEDNSLTTLDLSGNSQLETVYCYNNQLTSLKVPKVNALKMLSCSMNNLTSLDISGCTGLETLADYDNPIATLNASGCSSLKEIDEFKEDGNGTLTSLNVAGCTSVEQIFVNSNQLTSLDISDCVALKYLNCHTNQLEALDISHNVNLEVLMCAFNNLTELDLSHNTNLNALFCHENQLSRLDLSNNLALENISCGSNPLGTLDVTKNVALKYLQCDVNDLSELDVTKNVNLEWLDFVVNNITSIDLSKNTKLTTLRAGGNYLTSLNLSNNAALNHVECDVNAMPFSGFIGFTDYDEFTYAPQSEYQIPSNVQVGESIDLSSEYSVNGTVTVFKWYDEDGNVITPATANGGVFTFGNDAAGKTLVCKMTNAKLPDFKEEYIDPDDPEEEPQDYRLTTTQVTVEGNTPSDPGDDTPSNPNDNTSSDPNDNNSSNKANNNVPYYDLTIDENNIINDVVEVKYPEGTNYEVDGKWTSPKNVRLTVGNIEENKKKSVLDAIKKYNETFDTDTSDIALYNISLTDTNKAHVTLRNGHVLICLKYPDNLGRQSEDYIFHLYHQKKDGNVEEIPVICRSNGIWFYATDFSPYVLYWHPASVGSGGTGESFTLILVMTALCALSLVGVGYVLYRRKKTTTE